MSNGCTSKLAPLLLIILFGASYIIYIYYFCFRTVQELQNRLIFLVFIHVFTSMLIWSFLATMCSSVGIVPIEYKFARNQHLDLIRAETDDEQDAILENVCEDQNLVLHTCTSTGSIRYCVHCMHIKPDRTHHCSTCQTCYLRMDHHCPWVDNCIGFYNYKNFVLLVFYTFTYCLYFVATTMSHIIYSLDRSQYKDALPLCLGFGFTIVMGLVTFGFFCYHLYLICINQTTLESVHPQTFTEDDMTFDLGVSQNCVDTFGTDCYLWFLPIFSSPGSGHMFLVERK